MFTIFDLLRFVGPIAGALAGLIIGNGIHARGGGLAGVILGLFVGLIVGRIPELWVMKIIASDLVKKSIEELHDLLHSGTYPTPNAILLELDRRGVDIKQELPFLFESLSSDSPTTRARAWAALTTAFPEVAKKFGGYRPHASTDECRRRVGSVIGS